MRARLVTIAVAVALAVGGCGSSTPAVSVSVAPVTPTPAGAEEVTTAPEVADTDCDIEASLRPGPLPPPGAMPPGSTMAAIAERGRLVVGVDQSTYLFGFRNPSTGQLEGFDIAVAREIARAIFGDPNRIDLRVVTASQRETALTSGQVDLVARTYSITCDRKENVAFSTVYFYAQQRILALKGSGITSTASLADKRVCAVSGTTSMAALFALDPRPTLFGVRSWTDCLVMLQQGQVDAISTDDVVLFGLAAQDPTVQVVGASIGNEPYGIGIKKENEDLVRFVNGVLDQMRRDGTWERLYDAGLSSLGPSPGPPPARYQD
ncbi:glutamate ABC transporter substrate-binding protein [Mycobacterium sp. Y57]|uniref:glutamate ABC transporter substrate-binding protein n=1 Tax=Mycolicibacterium xanthum TaxID=2796469 RepID=UPI001C84105B|nr:glutamate ABC transporter substrate-binding protein [Mycolicibacterium xanthum]MBX7435402.1 glutamate ABC transporter substrate-binding protein [Mycolicibacterium xanthum]